MRVELSALLLCVACGAPSPVPTAASRAAERAPEPAAETVSAEDTANAAETVSAADPAANCRSDHTRARPV